MFFTDVSGPVGTHKLYRSMMDGSDCHVVLSDLSNPASKSVCVSLSLCTDIGLSIGSFVSLFLDKSSCYCFLCSVHLSPNSVGCISTKLINFGVSSES